MNLINIDNVEWFLHNEYYFEFKYELTEIIGYISILSQLFVELCSQSFVKHLLVSIFIIDRVKKIKYSHCIDRRNEFVVILNWK